MQASEILNLDMTALSVALRMKQISSVELTRAYLHRIASVDARLGSYLTVLAEDAMREARAADAKGTTYPRVPLHGIPIALKDNIYTQGKLTTAGSKVLGDFRPDFDATVWQRLSGAGAILLGKLNLNEFAYGGLNKACRNPYDLNRLPGGSSAGAGAGVAGRTVVAALGTDTSGSIRIPAAMCGCVGLKPTWSRVSRHGVIPLAESMDCVGPLTRSVRDAALMLSIIAGRDASDSTSSSLPVPEYSAVLQKGVAGLRIGVVRELNNNLAPEVRRLFERALKQLNDLGAHVDEVSIPSIELGALINAVVTYVEALEYHQPWLAERGGLYGDACRLQLETGLLMSATNYVRAQKGRARVLAQTLRAMEKFDVIVAPGVATVATSVKDQARIEQKDSGDQGYNDMLRFTQPFDATGQPVLALPTGLTADGLPASIQIIARPFDEALLFQVGAALERARGPLEPPAL